MDRIGRQARRSLLRRQQARRHCNVLAAGREKDCPAIQGGAPCLGKQELACTDEVDPFDQPAALSFVLRRSERLNFTRPRKPHTVLPKRTVEASGTGTAAAYTAKMPSRVPPATLL